MRGTGHVTAKNCDTLNAKRILKSSLILGECRPGYKLPFNSFTFAYQRYLFLISRRKLNESMHQYSIEKQFVLFWHYFNKSQSTEIINIYCHKFLINCKMFAQQNCINNHS